MRDAGRGGDRTKRNEGEPRNIIELVALCARRPSLFYEVGLGGISGRGILVQIALALLLLAFASATAEHALGGGSAVASIGTGIAGMLAAVVSLLALSVSLWLMAQFVRPGARFRDLLSGLGFLNVVASLLRLAVQGLVGIVLLLGGTGVLPEAATGGATSIIGLAHFVVSLILVTYFLMGVFDLGCVTSLVLGLIAVVLAVAVTVTVASLLAGFIIVLLLTALGSAEALVPPALGMI
jgi:hypothetical protein